MLSDLIKSLKSVENLLNNWNKKNAWVCDPGVLRNFLQYLIYHEG